jgi:hypothetical protein
VALGKKVKIDKTVTIDGVKQTQSLTVTADNRTSISPTSIGAAKTGQLTTRTDNDTGTLTMASGHGITTGARLDLYWFNSDGTVLGHRRGILVGTVSTNSVPIDAGAGDNLPTNLTNIKAMVPNSETVSVVGANAVHVSFTCDLPAVVVFAQADNTEIAYKVFTAADGGSWSWTSGVDDAANPVTGQTVGKVFVSQGSSAAAPQTVECNLLWN